jgi:hypothetical protein
VKRNGRNDQPCRAKSWIDFLQTEEAVNQQTRTYQQYHRERELRHNETISELITPKSLARSTHVCLERFTEADTRGSKRRCKAEKNSCD